MQYTNWFISIVGYILLFVFSPCRLHHSGGIVNLLDKGCLHRQFLYFQLRVQTRPKAKLGES